MGQTFSLRCNYVNFTQTLQYRKLKTTLTTCQTANLSAPLLPQRYLEESNEERTYSCPNENDYTLGLLLNHFHFELLGKPSRKELEFQTHQVSFMNSSSFHTLSPSNILVIESHSLLELERTLETILFNPFLK